MPGSSISRHGAEIVEKRGLLSAFRRRPGAIQAHLAERQRISEEVRTKELQMDGAGQLLDDATYYLEAGTDIAARRAQRQPAALDAIALSLEIHNRDILGLQADGGREIRSWG